MSSAKVSIIMPVYGVEDYVAHAIESIQSKEKEFNFELVFKICYLVLTLISFNTFVAQNPLLTYISYGIVAFASLIIINRLTHIKDYINKFVVLLVLFIASYIISSLHTRQYGITENIKAVIWMSIQYFVLFANDKNQPKELKDKELTIFSFIFISYTFVCSVAGIVMMICGYGTHKMIDQYVINAGFVWNRLWGCYTDPNYGAVFAVISSFLSIYLIKTLLNKKLKIFLIVNVVFEYLYLCYSDSRTGIAALIVSMSIFLFLIFYRKTAETGIKKVLFTIFLPVLISVVIALTLVPVRLVTSAVQTKIAYSNLIAQGLSPEEAEALADEDRVGREDEEINNGDVSNNRFDIWSAGVDIFKSSPIVGVSFRNIMPYSIENFPNGFITKSGFESMHNSFVDILVSQGLLGIAIVLPLIVLVIIRLFKVVPDLNDKDYQKFAFIFAIITAIFTEMLFYSETFYMNTAAAFLFWCLLGQNINENTPKFSSPKN